MADQDEPSSEEEWDWCLAQRGRVADYLERQGVRHGRIGEVPAWHVAPYVTVWAIESLTRPGWVGGWVISGDLPTDHTGSDEGGTPRDAVRDIARRWAIGAAAMAEGRAWEGHRLGGAQNWPDLAPLLASRASLLLKWADDDGLWPDATLWELAPPAAGRHDA